MKVLAKEEKSLKERRKKESSSYKKGTFGDEGFPLSSDHNEGMDDKRMG